MPRQPLPRRGIAAIADDEADAVMAERQQIGRHVERRPLIVHQDGARGLQRPAGLQPHERNRAPLQLVDHPPVVAGGRGEDQPVGMRLIDQRDDIVEQRGRGPIIGLGDHPHMRRGAPLAHPGLDLVDVPRIGVIADQRDLMRSPTL